MAWEGSGCGGKRAKAQTGQRGREGEAEEASGEEGWKLWAGQHKEVLSFPQISPLITTPRTAGTAALPPSHSRWSINHC